MKLSLPSSQITKTLFMDASNFSQLNWLHVLVAAIAYFAVGALWYSVLFGKRWVAYQKIDMNDPRSKEGTAPIMIGSFVWMFITSAALAMLVHRLELSMALSGVKLGLFTGVCFSAAAISISYLYVKKAVGLHAIDCLYHIVGQIVAAVILCVWR
jgi:hypothetical protein